MNSLQTVFAAILGATFLGSGLVKLTNSREKLAAGFLTYMEDLTETQAKSIGMVETAAGASLVVSLHSATGPWLAGTAAFGVCLLMIGAARTHLRRRELWMLPVNLLIAAMSLALALSLPPS